ncbi:NAD-dependent DNA ligase LigB [compost metagenome]
MDGDWASLSDRTAEDWRRVAGVGEARAARLTAFFQHPEVRALAEQLQAAGVDGFSAP